MELTQALSRVLENLNNDGYSIDTETIILKDGKTITKNDYVIEKVADLKSYGHDSITYDKVNIALNSLLSNDGEDNYLKAFIRPDLKLKNKFE